jgi:hypothetical protein
VLLSEEAVSELEFWSGNLSQYNSMPIRENRHAVRVDFKGASDAGAVGYGAWFCIDEGCSTEMVQEISNRVASLSEHRNVWENVVSKLRSAVDFRGELSEEQQARSSTWREAWAVCEFMEFAAPVLAGCRVRLQLDNSSVVFGLGGVVKGFEGQAYGGSKKPDIQALIVRIFNVCVKERVTLHAVWVPREQNTEADELSKMTDHYDFALSKLIFRKLDAWWGPHTVDCFSLQNSVLVRSGRFNSQFWQPGAHGCIGVDAFVQDWQGEVNWVHAPYKLIGKVIQHMKNCKARGTMVVPWWEKAPWWPLLLQGNSWVREVKQVHRIGQSVGTFKGARSRGALVVGNSTAAELAELPVGELWALCIDCSQ